LLTWDIKDDDFVEAADSFGDIKLIGGMQNGDGVYCERELMDVRITFARMKS